VLCGVGGALQTRHSGSCVGSSLLGPPEGG